MAELKIYLADDLDMRFRKAAMSAFGYGHGSLSKAAVEALSRWCYEREVMQPKPNDAHKVELSPEPLVRQVREGRSGGEDYHGGSPTPAS